MSNCSKSSHWIPIDLWYVKLTLTWYTFLQIDQRLRLSGSFYSSNTDKLIFGRDVTASHQYDAISPPYCMLPYNNTLRPRQNGRNFADDTFKYIFLNENVIISAKIPLKFVPKGPINSIPALVQIMAWRRSGDKPLSEPMMVRLPTHICVTRPQWVNIPEVISSNDFRRNGAKAHLQNWWPNAGSVFILLPLSILCSRQMTVNALS